MTTQKKYHDLVLIDKNNEENDFGKKKLMSVLLLFLVGVGIGGGVISVLSKEGVTQAKPTILPASYDNNSVLLQEITPTVLQPITNAEASSSSGCSIESLGRNPVGQGCSVDGGEGVSISETPANGFMSVTGLSDLTASNKKEIKKTNINTNQDTGITNILDLQ